MIKDLEREMREAATNLEFERAERLREEVKRLREMEPEGENALKYAITGSAVLDGFLPLVCTHGYGRQAGLVVHVDDKYPRAFASKKRDQMKSECGLDRPTSAMMTDSFFVIPFSRLGARIV